MFFLPYVYLGPQYHKTPTIPNLYSHRGPSYCMETIEVSADALEALWAHVDVEHMRERNPEAVSEVNTIVAAMDSERVSIVHE